jgi:hypothetical protein
MFILRYKKDPYHSITLNFVIQSRSTVQGCQLVCMYHPDQGGVKTPIADTKRIILIFGGKPVENKEKALFLAGFLLFSVVFIP